VEGPAVDERGEIVPPIGAGGAGGMCVVEPVEDPAVDAVPGLDVEGPALDGPALDGPALERLQLSSRVLECCLLFFFSFLALILATSSNSVAFMLDLLRSVPTELIELLFLGDFPTLGFEAIFTR